MDPEYIDTFAQAEQLKHYRSANALNDYKVQALEREAETPGLNWLASEEGQRQHAANTGFAQAVNYQRSGAATPEVEYLRAVDSMMDRYGDKPAATEYKARMRNAMIQAIAAGGGPQVDHIVSQILANNRATGGGAGSVSNRTQKAPPPEPSSGLTPEEQAELDMLRRKFGR